MSRQYKFKNKEGVYFVSFATVYWIDVLVRQEYCSFIAQSLQYCIKDKGLNLYSWCIMPSHLHLIFEDRNNTPEKLLQDFKKYTSKNLYQIIREHPQESRKEWILWMMQRAGKKLNQEFQFWQQHNKPIELWTHEVFLQKLNYIHTNPVVAGFVSEPQHWKYSSAIDYSGGKGLVTLAEL